MSNDIIPGAVSVAVSSGKGGVGKTTTAVSIAAALSARGLDVVVIDADLTGPNVHLVANAPTTMNVDPDGLRLELPVSAHGFRIATAASVPTEVSAVVKVADLVAFTQFADPPQVVVIDLPAGWSDEHDAVCSLMPNLVVTPVAPTPTALADHDLHIEAWKSTWTETVRRRKDRDKRRKVTLPAEPAIAAIETMARFTGIPETGGDPVTIRRIDAVPADEVNRRAAPVTSLPAAADIETAAAALELGVVTDLIVKLIES